MKNFYWALFFLLPTATVGQVEDPANIQVQSTPDGDVEKLVFEEFISQGNCVEVFNIQRIGNVNSIGSFSNGLASIGIENGIVFTTGELENIKGPNISSETSGGLYGPSTDPFLSKVVGNAPVFDVIGIEFDFIPTGDFVSFDYVFASEEYCEFVGTEFNDVFGFFVSGPGIVGNEYNKSINVATIEGRDEVAINSVNHLDNTDFFISNRESCEIDDVGKVLNTIEFDGFTIPLQAFFNVIPCETYHIRLVVGDVGDEFLDSAVFLKGKSFDIGAKATIRTLVNNSSQDSLIYENCLEGSFLINRSKLSDRGKPLEVDLFFLGTATNGEDFLSIPEKITLEARENIKEIPISMIPDEALEGEEYVDVVVRTKTCDCEELDTTRLYIRDTKEDISVEFSEEVVCPSQPFQISPAVPDGIEPLFYQWDTGDSTSFIVDEITSPKRYVVTVTDVCGASNSDSVEVQIQPVPSLELVGDFGWCEGRILDSLLVDFPGQAPWSLEYTIDNAPLVAINEIMENPYVLPFEQVGTYTFEGFNDKHCNGIIEGTVEISDISFLIESVLTRPSCFNATDGQIDLQFEGGQDPFTILWDSLEEQSNLLSNIPAGDYSVQVVDQMGCVIQQDFFLPQALPTSRCRIDLAKSLYIPNAFSPNADGINDSFTIFFTAPLIQSVKYSIFDRWGNRIYTSVAYSKQDAPDFWDGGEMPAGVYVCLVEVFLADGSRDHFGTDVTLVL